ncbi:MAG TPA: hypothetical protein VK655_08620, partial [Solirubrobacteraceae bacterium]|nr:hypothetical protein [Solirubrobacteraceae bacterium]
MSIGQTVLNVVPSVDPTGLDIRQPTIAHEMPSQLPEALAPTIWELSIGRRSATNNRLCRHLDLE